MTSHKTNPSLPAHIRRLDPVELLVVQYCAVLDEPATPVSFANFLLEEDPSLLPSETLNSQTIRDILKDLQKKEILSSDHQLFPGLGEIICRAIPLEQLRAMIDIVRKTRPALPPQGVIPALPHAGRLRRDLRLDLCSHDFDRYSNDLLLFLENYSSSKNRHPLVDIINKPFNREWFTALPAHIQIYCLQEIIKNSFIHLESMGSVFYFLLKPENCQKLPEEALPAFHYLRITALLLAGRTTQAEEGIHLAGDAITAFGLEGWLACIQGNYKKSRQLYEKDLTLLRTNNQNEKAYFTGLEGIFYILALLQAEKAEVLGDLLEILDNLPLIQPGNPHLPAYNQLRRTVGLQWSVEDLQTEKSIQPYKDPENGLTPLFRAWNRFWTDAGFDDHCLVGLDRLYKQAKDCGQRWLAYEYAELLHRIAGDSSCRKYCSRIKLQTGFVPIIDIVCREEPWQRALKALNIPEALVLPGIDEKPKSRLVWFIDLDVSPCILAPKEQKFTSKNTWSKGRLIKLASLAGDEDPPTCLSQQDQDICATIYKHQPDSNHSYTFEQESALATLVGHPYLFLFNNPKIQVHLLKGEPEVRVIEKENSIHISLYPDFQDEPYVIKKEANNKYRFFSISKEHRRYARIIGPQGLTIPLSAKDRTLQVLGNLKPSVTIHAALKDDSFSSIETVPADPRIHIHLVPHGNSFRVSFFVFPFGRSGPALSPGQGTEKLVTEISGQRLQTKRNLLDEEKRAQLLERTCTSLGSHENFEREWILADTKACLHLLNDLQTHGNEVIVAWPEGRRLSISRPVSFEQLNLQVRKKRNWFELEGQLELDDSLVLDMQQLLSLTEETASRFLPLGSGHFITLSQELRQQLEDLNAVADAQKKNTRLHPLAALGLDKLRKSGARLAGDDQWRSWTSLTKDSRTYNPPLPKGLRADLRDYQVEGFRWLARLSRWGVGACLADDMGLGKTVQALSVILHLADKGPTLVIAPTSVCRNWQEEVERFAPELRVILFGGKNRQELLSTLSPFDLVICSYGLLQQEAEIMAETKWQTIVLDEAQAIKNMSAKRSRAAMRLQGEFRLITTGTPIENHLGELWNLFHFINPGLLGSLKQFQKRFAQPIERDDNKSVRRKLKKIVQPFILRRFKSEVLQELPPRTEVTLKIQMKETEAAFYEALRLNARKSLNENKTDKDKTYVRILAEITRLRRACCNSKLILPDSDIPCAKLEQFGHIVDELLEGDHRALVFSQFVDHLSLVREYLDAKSISYQYFDGSTSAVLRQKRVKDFQAGKGSLFLISLKAGGVGLNLTAADYVVHLDPWWHPAVEDQASDRAHRIGQTQPVTVYRLVTENTIEEKIVELHQAKRDLAESLLEGGELTGKMNAEELLSLIMAN